MRRVALVCLLGVLSPPAWAQVRAGGEFQVNTYTTGVQGFGSLAVNDNGDFVVVWQSIGQDGDGYGVRWRKFSSAGVPQASGAANTYTTSNQIAPSVAVDSSGRFVMAWMSQGQDGDGYGIFARQFDASGSPQGPEFKVNGHTQDTQSQPHVAVAANGNFVVTWRSNLQDGSYYGVFGRLFDSTGTSITGFQANTYTTGSQFGQAVAMDASGRFVVVWDGAGATDPAGVFAQRYDATGAPLGGQFRVNSDTPGMDVFATPSLAMDANGNFVVAWQGPPSASGDGIFARRFDASGAAQGSEFQVSTYTTINQFDAAVASDEHGNFVVTWHGLGWDGSGVAIVGRQFDAAGAPQGSEFVVNSYTTGNQIGSSVASSPDGDFVVSWTSQDEDGSGYGVFAQRFGDLIFEDNFESGDTSRWSVSQTGGTDLAVTAGAGLAGTGHGMRTLVNDTGSLYVQDDTPAAETRYRARFYFDPNSFDPGEADGHQRIRMFLAQDATSLRIVTIVLKRLSGQYSLEARTRQNDGSRVDTGFFPITNAPHFVEFDWHRANPGVADGILIFYIDSTILSVLTDLDNDQGLVESGRLGALSLKTGASGTLRFDQFESRRANLIGAE
jgi:hypothetical protein